MRRPLGHMSVLRHVHRATGDVELGPVRRRQLLDRVRYRLRVAKSISAKRLSLRNTSSTKLTLSTNSAQSNHEIRRMLVITLRTVTFIVAIRWCSSCTSSSAVALGRQQLLQLAERGVTAQS